MASEVVHEMLIGTARGQLVRVAIVVRGQNHDYSADSRKFRQTLCNALSAEVYAVMADHKGEMEEVSPDVGPILEAMGGWPQLTGLGNSRARWDWPQ